MKITREQLKQLIKEELEEAMEDRPAPQDTEVFVRSQYDYLTFEEGSVEEHIRQALNMAGEEYDMTPDENQQGNLRKIIETLQDALEILDNDRGYNNIADD